MNLQLIENGLNVFVGLGVTRHDQPAAINDRDPDLDQLNGCELVQYGRRRQTRSMNQQLVLQGDLQTISKECDEHMRIGAVFELMIDGPDTEFAFQPPAFREHSRCDR